MADFKGLKMRMPSLGGKVLERVGGTAVLSPGSELYTNLERGVIDATEWIGPYHDYLMGFHQIAKYYYYPGWHEPGSLLENMINKRDWDNLSPDLKQIVREASERLNKFVYTTFRAKNFEYLQKIKAESDVQVIEFSSEVLASLKGTFDQILQEEAQKDQLFKRVYTAYQDFRSTYAERDLPPDTLYFNRVI